MASECKKFVAFEKAGKLDKIKKKEMKILMEEKRRYKKRIKKASNEAEQWYN